MLRFFRQRNAFTLVEMLVVIAILAILMAFLLPALGRARSQAQVVCCESNLRQIGAALQMYANDNRDHFPDAVTLGNWSYRMAPGRVTLNDPGALPEVYGLAAVLHGIAWNSDLSHGLPKPQYLPGNSKVWVCPSASLYYQDQGNTYAFSIAASMAQWTSIFRSHRANNVIVWDNYTMYPGLTGFRGTFSGYTVPTAQRTYPHPVSSKGKWAVAELYLGGYVMLRQAN